MQLRSQPLDELAIPDDTTVEEHDLVTDGDVIVGGQSTVEFGVRGHDVVAGERVSFGGHIEAEGDCRLDMWSDVDADVLVGEDAYLGERVSIGGELKVAGNLDIGDDVDIDEGFEANGWITIRNPMPTIVFLVVYLSQLLRIGEEEAAEELADHLVDAGERDQEPVVVPRGARVSDETWRVSTPATVGDDCRLHGNLRAESVSVGDDTTIFGSLRARGDVEVGAQTEIKGNVTTRNGDVRVDRGAHVWGDISAEDVELHEHAVVEGTIRVDGELTQLRDPLGPEPADAADATDTEDAVDAGDAADATETSIGDDERDGAEPDADSSERHADSSEPDEAPAENDDGGASDGNSDGERPLDAQRETLEGEALDELVPIPIAEGEGHENGRGDDHGNARGGEDDHHENGRDDDVEVRGAE
ncbi:MAG: polymer-forming cytoskeletal protein [Haloarculaceae archaeon]